MGTLTRFLAAAPGLLAMGAALAAGAGAEWTTPAGNPQAMRYSELAQIHAGNAGTLVEEFSVATGTRGGHQGQPLVVGSTMYLVTPFPNKLIALDLNHPGTVKWTFSPKVNGYARGVACCDTVNRGPAYADGKVIYNLLDDSTVAVDAVTGQQVWRTRHGDVTTGETLTGAPIIAKDKVILGNAGGELGIRGWVKALRVSDGQQVWKAFSTGPDSEVLITGNTRPWYAKDRGTDLGVSTWPGTTWQQGGSTSWAWFSYDPALNLVYYGTGNPGVWNPDMRKGDNKWGSSIFARNADTGEAAWVYQLTPHDGWDYDAVNESILVDLTIKGKTRQALVHFNKNGFAYTMDRGTGEVLVAEKFAHTTWAEQVNLKTGAPAVVPAMQPHQGETTSGICPSPLGGKDWEPSAYSPQTGLFYVPAINFCNSLEPLKAIYIAGTPFMGADIAFQPAPGGYMGELVAWDASTGQRAWSLPEALPVYSGVMATAGNLVFYGTLDGHFKALNATTGQVVFDKQLECGIIGSPIAYGAPDGSQRVAVYTGIGWLPGGFAGGPCPAGGGFAAERSEGQRSPLAGAVARLSTARGAKVGAQAATSGMLHVFKLP